MARQSSGSLFGGVKSLFYLVILVIVVGGVWIAYTTSNNINPTDWRTAIHFLVNGSRDNAQKGVDCSSGDESACQDLKDSVGAGDDKSTAANSPSGKKNDTKSAYTAKVDRIPTIDKQDTAYSRSDWKHWVSQGQCDTRVEVLRSQGENVTLNGCKITGGTWRSLYDNKVVTQSKLIDIDHVIPLGYAARHGGGSWDAATKQAFANDTSQLVAVSRESNRAKSDKGPGEWMPEDSYKCEYSKKWVDTIEKYPGLGVSAKDKEALKSGLATC